MQKILVDQLLVFPHPSANDDGPDALEGSVRKLVARIRRRGGLPRSAGRREADTILRGYS